MATNDATDLGSTTEAEMRALALHILTQGQQGEAPAWFKQLNESRALLCPPWELNEVHPELPRATKAEWVRRVGMVIAAEQLVAAERLKAQRRGGLLVPQ